MRSEQACFQAALELVDRALDLPLAEREAVLQGEADPEVQAQARRLLEADQRADDFLNEPAAHHLSSAVASLARAAPAARAGEQIGPFRLRSLLGHGGMGEVWLAERAGADFQQQVAIKLLPLSSGPEAAARFRRERRILGRLSHPHIARLLDGGLTASGHPWLAMELVPGTNLAEHCARERLGVEARLRLIAEVCDAVQFAHQNLVVHRDLKPSNVLVGPGGAPKLLDFGIAKLLQERSEDGVLTHAEERPMTLQYAAPEQLRAGDITTATDVWALGVMLYELLSGRKPFTGASRVETEEAILAASPLRPSVEIDPSCLAPGESLSERRGRLRGDLEAIILKAIRPSPGDRYPSAEALALDVRRHLARAPVSARGDATGYLLRTMLRRHRAAFSLVATALLALVLGMATTLWQARRAREEARRSERAQDFLVGVLRAFDPRDSGDRPMTQREILARGEDRLDELKGEPEIQARLLQVFAETWYDLGDYQRGKASAERALELQRAVAPRSADVARTLLLLGNLHFELGEYLEAARLIDQALPIARAAEGARGALVARALNDLAGVQRRLTHFADAERLRREALEIYRLTLGDRNPETLGVMNDLAVLIGDEGHFAESAQLQEQTCRLMESAGGKTHADTLICWSNLARDLVELGRASDAEALASRVQAQQIATFGGEWGDLPAVETIRARALDALGRSAEAVQVFEDAISRATRSSGAEPGQIASFLTYESMALRHQRRIPEAERVARQALAIAVRRFGEEHATTARAHYALGCALFDLGRRDEARAETTRALGVQERMLGAGHADTLRTRAEAAHQL